MSHTKYKPPGSGIIADEVIVKVALRFYTKVLFSSLMCGKRVKYQQFIAKSYTRLWVVKVAH